MAEGGETSTTSKTIIKTWLFALLFVAGALLLWQISGLILIIFFGVLLAILLDGAGRLLVKVLPVSRTVATIATALITVAVLVVGMWLMGPQPGGPGDRTRPRSHERRKVRRAMGDVDRCGRGKR